MVCALFVPDFSRLKINYAVKSKRKLLQLVDENHVLGWDGPWMLTISGLRRQGLRLRPYLLLRQFRSRKRDSRIDMGMLENTIRDDLNNLRPKNSSACLLAARCDCATPTWSPVNRIVTLRDSWAKMNKKK